MRGSFLCILYVWIQKGTFPARCFSLYLSGSKKRERGKQHISWEHYCVCVASCRRSSGIKGSIHFPYYCILDVRYINVNVSHHRIADGIWSPGKRTSGNPDIWELFFEIILKSGHLGTLHGHLGTFLLQNYYLI